MHQFFRDRSEAGLRLAERLLDLKDENPVVLALPRGGLPVAFEVARALGAPLDVIVVRKIGAPGRPELGVGAVGEDGARFLDETILRHLGLDEAAVADRIAQATSEVEARVGQYRGTHPRIPIRGRTVIVVDDGIATGGTMRAALQVARQQGAAKVVVAVPVAGPESLQKIAPEADAIVCVEVSSLIWAVGLAYERFEQVPDAAVQAYLDAASEAKGAAPARVAGERPVRIAANGVTLDGDLTLPRRPRGLVLFAHGSGSGRRSRRNRRVARSFQEAGLATLLFDLLSREEAERDAITGEHRFDIALLTRRMVGALDWAAAQPSVGPLPKACYGSSTGAAAALAAAAQRPQLVAAVVSRGGRPDLAARWLPRVQAPCLFIVGEHDAAVLSIHAQMIDRVAGHTRLAVIPGAGHLFEEPGALEEVARWATEFLRAHLRPAAEARP
jgi:putative phosphoribosyl transferase